MSWLPPWSFAARGQWAEAHPWRAGFLSGLMMAIVVGVYVGIRTGAGAAVIVGTATVLVLWPLFALAVKGRWGQQPGVENVDFGHFLRRPWSRLPGRVLLWFIWLLAFVACMSVVELVIGPTRVTALLNLSVSSLLLGTAWVERRRRMSE